jgi:ABC-type methionine transport system permease subunit
VQHGSNQPLRVSYGVSLHFLTIVCDCLASVAHVAVAAGEEFAKKCITTRHSLGGVVIQLLACRHLRDVVAHVVPATGTTGAVVVVFTGGAGTVGAAQAGQVLVRELCQ